MDLMKANIRGLGFLAYMLISGVIVSSIVSRCESKQGLCFLAAVCANVLIMRALFPAMFQTNPKG